jgi:carbamoyl-phosphate synthase large subunit
MSIPAVPINKLQDGSPHVVDWIERGDVELVINTPSGSGARSDGYEIRAAAVARGIPCITTISGAMAAVRAIAAGRRGEPGVISLQDLHRSDEGDEERGAVCDDVAASPATTSTA